LYAIGGRYITKFVFLLPKISSSYPFFLKYIIKDKNNVVHKEKFRMINLPANDQKKILSRIGTKVYFKYPGEEGDKHGILKDRTVVESTNASGAVPYWDVVDLIEFKGEKEPE
jgi:hypothetical protein